MLGLIWHLFSSCYRFCWRPCRRRCFFGKQQKQQAVVQTTFANTVTATTTTIANQTSCSSLYVDLHDIPNPKWEDLRAILVIGKNSLGPALGSTIKVKTENLVVKTNPRGEGQDEFECCNNKQQQHLSPQDIRIHTVTHSCISPSNFKTMTRWYQQQQQGNVVIDHNNKSNNNKNGRLVQVFRMFPGDDNIRNNRKFAPRIEAFVPRKLQWKRGYCWHEWSGIYTFIKLRNGCIFQLKHNVTYWSIQLCVQEQQQDGTFDLCFQKLHDKTCYQTLVKNILLQSIHVRILDNGTNYKVFINGESKVVGTFVDRTDAEFNCPRWGFYSPKSAMNCDILLFTSHVYVGKARE